MTKVFDLRVISLGAGVQSSCMYLRAVEGDFGPCDLAIFADTQCEPAYVYDQLEYLRSVGSETIPIVTATAGSLMESVEKASRGSEGRFASVPFWVMGDDGREAPGRRQCTREYKIDVVKKAIRKHFGLAPGKHMAGVYNVEEWIGISVDEASRAKPSRYSWSTSRWPLLYDIPMRRQDCIDWMVNNGHPMPRKSACSFCPWRNLDEWRKMQSDDPLTFEEACRVDEMIRERGPMKGMERLQYVHRSLRPLREVVDDVEQFEQIDLFQNECEGMCGL